MKSPNVIIGLIGIIIAVIAGGFCIKYGLGKFEKPGPGFLPLIICGLIIFLNLLLILKEPSKKDQSIKIAFTFGPKWRNVVFLSAACMIYTILWDALGFILNTFALTGLSLRFVGKEPVTKSIIFSAIFAVVFYIVFKKYLNCDLPEGLLPLRL